MAVAVVAGAGFPKAIVAVRTVPGSPRSIPVATTVYLVVFAAPPDADDGTV
jgi:hypothetical protein